MADVDDPRYRGRPSPWSFLGPLLVLLCVVCVLAWLVGGWGRRGGDAGNNPHAEPRTVAARGDLAADEKATIELFKQASPGVVFITSLSAVRDRFSLNVQEIPRGTGTGFVWDDQGHI